MFVAYSELIWLQSLLTELGFSKVQPTPVHADNTSAIQIVFNLVYHKRIKHMQVDCHSIQEAFDHQVITLPHITTTL